MVRAAAITRAILLAVVVATGVAAQQRPGQLSGDIGFSVPSGTFRGQLSVRLATDRPGAEIRYTTDGTIPTVLSSRYDGDPISVTTTTQLRARAFVGASGAGPVGTALYVARATDARHDLPLVVMDGYGGGKPDRDDYRDVAFMVMEPRGDEVSLAQTPAVATRAGFHLRGQSSATFEKAPYRIELRDDEDRDADYPLLDMPADADWVLRGPFPDKSLIRDALAYQLAEALGLRAPRYAFVELYLNLDRQPLSADDYQGVYLLVETIKRSPDRLDLAKLSDTDLTPPAVSGGYIMQFNSLVAEPPLVECTQHPGQPTAPCWTDLEILEPKDPLPAQQAWLTGYLQRFHDALHGPDPANPLTGYPAYLEVESFVNRIILNELSRPSDAYVRSTHFFKDRGGKLFCGPVWDYDLSFGAFTGFGGGSATIQGWGFQPQADDPEATDWFLALMRDPAFAAQVEARWRQLRQGDLSDQRLQARIAAIAEPLANAAERNFERWPNLATPVVGGLRTQVTQTWQEQLILLRSFLTQRAAWLDRSGWRPTEQPAA